MAQPTDRSSFKEWCLRKLGKPVLTINLDDTQIEDRIDEAISYWNDFHFDGTEKLYLKHQITSGTINNGYIIIPENVIGVVRIFDISPSAISGSTSADIFSANYQFYFSHIHDIASYNMTNYYLSLQHLSLIDELLSGKQPIRYNKHANKLYIDMDTNRLKIGQYLIIECYSALDGELYQDMWKDRWLQNYATAKIQMNWAQVLLKFQNMQMPGGTQFNADYMLTEAKEQIEKLETEMNTTYSIPSTDFIG